MNCNNQGTSKCPITVAVCQTLCLPGDLQGNRHRIECALDRAAKQSADIACFPETAFLGWVNPGAHDRAGPIPGDWSDWIARRASEYEIFIAIGLAEKDADGLYNSAILVDPDGAILLKHRKINTLVHLMDPPYHRGDINDIAVADTQFGKIGMLICADTFESEIRQAMAAHRPDLLVVPYGWVAEAHRWPEHGQELTRVVKQTIADIGCPVIGTDSVGIITDGKWAGRTFGGHSVICDADGRVLITAADRTSDIEIVNIESGTRSD